MTCHICAKYNCIEDHFKIEPVNQKPVGVYYGFTESIGHRVRLDVDLPIGSNLYAAPVERQWVDLTDDKISRLWYDSSYGDSGIDFARAVITAFKEKNK